MMVRHLTAQASACVLALALGATAASAQIPDWDREHTDLHARSVDEQRLRTLLADYDTGGIDGAVATLARERSRWSVTTLGVVLARLELDLEYHRRPARPNSLAEDERLVGVLRAERVQLLVLFAGLHLDASRRAGAVDPAASALHASEQAIDRLYALRADFTRNGPVPWAVDLASAAGGHSALAAPRSTVDWPIVARHVERWYAAAAARLQEAVEVTLQPALLARGLQRFPDSHDLLLARGTFQETHVALHRPDASLSRELESADDRRRWRDRLRAAEADYQRADDVTANDAETRIRLANVRLALGRADEARASLTDVLGRPLPTRTRYLALLFRGRASRVAGDVTAAAADYDAALVECPSATTPMLALATLADERGDAIASQRWMQQALASPLGLDPWRVYLEGQAWQLDARLESIRRLRE